MPEFQIRDQALQEDADFILEAFDATLPHLASIGSGSQWGSEPRSTNEQHIKKIREAIEKARSGTSDNNAVFIAELPINTNDDLDPAVAAAGRTRKAEDNQQMLQVGAAAVQGSFPAYVAEQENLEEYVRAAVERADYLYLFVLVSDFRVGALRKGVGAALARRVREYAGEKGKKAVYLDCWAGNGERLVGYVFQMLHIYVVFVQRVGLILDRFYKSQGYVPVDDFHIKKEDGTVWHGKLLRMDVEEYTSREG